MKRVPLLSTRRLGAVAVAAVSIAGATWALAQRETTAVPPPVTGTAGGGKAPVVVPVPQATPSAQGTGNARASGVGTPAAPTAPADPLVARGEYLARVADCVSCHTAPGGAPFAGGLPMATPFGTVISTNITPDTGAGIGTYTEEEFARAVREGVGKGGHRLYPAMPYASFARTSDEDVHALFAYFRQGVKPVANRPPETKLSFPFNLRPLLVFWNWLYLDDKRFEPDPARSAEWNRGAYLVNGLGHCGECHTPRSRLGGLKADSAADGDAFLSGAQVDGWYAQPLRHGAVHSAAQWSTAELVQYLRSGRTARSGAFGPMAQVVENSTQYMTPQDLGAMATYLQSVGAPAGYTPPPAPGPSPAATPAATDAPASAPPLHADAARLRDGTVEGQRGAMVYLNNCAGCHRSSGAGWERTFPALSGNGVVNAQDPTSLIRIVLQGAAMPATADAPTPLAMPGFGWRLDDEDVAQLLTFVRAGWGNKASAVTSAQVASVRKALPPEVKAAGK